jgi:superfamily I DNA and/or RNA helicase
MISTLPLLKHRELLQKEYEAEKDEYNVQTSKLSLRQRIAKGICIYPVTIGKSYYNSLNQFVAEFIYETDSEKQIAQRFEYGKPVVFFSYNEKEGSKHVKAGDEGKAMHRVKVARSTVSFSDEGRLVVALPDQQALITLQNTDNLCIQLYFDETSYQTMFRAIDEAINAKKGRLAELRDIFAGNAKPGKFVFNPLRFPWLNPSQEKAVNEVLWAKDVSIVHGPPGTGKTTTLVEAIYETLRRETQVMVCAQSNMAVDWISEKLVDHGINVLRIGNPSKINDKMLASSYERKFADHPDYPMLWTIRQAIRKLYDSRVKGDDKHDKINRLKDRANEIETRINESLFAEARVVASTLVGSANKILVGKKFSTVFIDEAAQAFEAACWIPLRRCGRIILAGDHCQLPPTVKSTFCINEQLTLMERVVESQPDCVTLLTIQYRMNEAIMRFSSEWFYEGKVTAAPEVNSRSILDYDLPIEWLDTAQMTKTECESLEQDGSENDALTVSSSDSNSGDFSESMKGESRINSDEAELVVDTLRLFIEKIGVSRFLDERMDVGVISPYKAQVTQIRYLIKRNDFLKRLRKSISVDTVDGFQGQERDIIIISMVRSNDEGNIGFLNDLRRMNVAITRARMKLIIIGNSDTMCRHPFYRKLKNYIDNNFSISAKPSHNQQGNS